nr:PREDICTED: deleted in malignant brain tumors 1 protein [Anolis carolinensis]XP_016848196.1 PREDICTED: deleted in malignant brain tumors 1 protein [Anolis carolinensis]|eukprot:XP_016848195.1 PREDICTED: deleted in malignant brain tumors 1 protein [Anolis carolinensis]
MVASIQRTYLQSIGYDAKDVYLKSPDSLCRPQITKDDVIFRIPFSGCGTVKQERSNGTITHSNIIMTSASGDIITREKNFQFHMVCEMNENAIVETMFISHNSVDITEIHRGSYHVTFNFYESPSFSNEVHSSPYYVSINQELYFQATLSSPDPNLVLFVDTCIASPYAHDFRTLTYDLIRSGCVRDSTYTNLPSPNKNAVRFKFNAFKFLKEHNSVYLQCKLVVCKANNPSSRCSQGCLSRKKRNIDENQDKVTFVVGPFKYRTG